MSKICLISFVLFSLLLTAGCSKGGSSDNFVSAQSSPVLVPGTETVLSTTPNTPGFDGQRASKAKLLRLIYSDGAGGFVKPLISVYGDAAGPDVWDFQGNTFAAKDIFVTRSLDDGLTWSQPLNLSLTANMSSLSADHDGDPLTAPLAYSGHSEKPNVFGTGKNILVSWVDRYVPGGLQGSVIYPESGGIEVPYAATYCVRSSDGGATWSAAEQLSDGLRDAKQDVNRGNGNGFAITWQEDPEGLQPGDAEGPGEGGSGAKVSKGTDIWMTALNTTGFNAGTLFPPAIRVTNNEALNRGGASRANLALIGNTALVAYEETKGLEGFDTGKYIRYHAISLSGAFDLAAASDSTAGEGWIISTPDENSRRVRILFQSTAGETTGIRLVFLWRQGLYDEGGPADIMMRAGYQNAADAMSNGFRPQDLSPMVSTGSTDRTVAFSNAAPINLSSVQGLDAASDVDAFENALAHRGVLRGEMIFMGYSYTADWAIANFTDLMNYNFFVRRSFDGGLTWDTPRNITNIVDTTISVREPRIVGTPSSPDPEDVRNNNTFLIAWGTAVNEYEHLSQGTLDLDVFLTRTTNSGDSYEVPQLITGLGSDVTREFESQFRLTPDGTTVFGVWMEEDSSGIVNALFNTFSE